MAVILQAMNIRKLITNKPSLNKHRISKQWLLQILETFLGNYSVFDIYTYYLAAYNHAW